MIRRHPLVALLSLLFVAVCAVLGARAPVDLDTIDVALAVQQQDLRLHQPPPPGAILYIWIVQLVHALTGNTLLALRSVALLTVVAAGITLFRLARTLFDPRCARWTLLFFLCSPLALFRGMTSSAASAPALAAALTVFLCLGARRESGLARRAYIIGLLAGLGQTVLLFTLPLLLLTLRRLRLDRGAAMHAGIAWCVGTLCWLVPQMEVAGGAAEYVRASAVLAGEMLRTAPVRAGFGACVDSLRTLVVLLLCGFGVVRVVGLLALRVALPRRPDAAPQGPRSFDRALVAAWVLPPLLFTTLLHPEGTGSAFAVWPALALGLAALLRSLLSGTRRWRRLTAVASTLLFLDVAIFFAVPPTLLEARLTAERDGARVEELAQGAPAAMHAWWMRAPDGLQATARRFFPGVDFFFDRTRVPEFDGFRRAVRALAEPPERVLLLGRRLTRAVCWFEPETQVIHAEPLRAESFLLYSGRRASRPDTPYEVAPRVTLILVEGSLTQLQIDSGARHPESGPLGARSGLRVLPVGDSALDAWFLPAGNE
ncbi:MAG: glycosyltransferase family 39 protein, partial [Candidatus Latescibacterota bacterium]